MEKRQLNRNKNAKCYIKATVGQWMDVKCFYIKAVNLLIQNTVDKFEYNLSEWFLVFGEY